MAAIGIDLGTSNSCIAFFKHGQADIITNNRNGRTTPSVVGFTDQQRLIGLDAKKIQVKYEQNVISGIKYMIGRKYGDPVVKEQLKNWAFNVVNKNDKIKIVVVVNNTTQYFVPEELSAILLKSLKEHAEARLGCLVTRAVITVPTYFADAQRQATKDAGEIAGFSQVKLVNESVAAAVAYGSNKSFTEDTHIFIFDFGGGTFDVSIIKCKKNDYDVIAIDGDLELGGEDLTNNIINSLIGKKVLKKRDLYRLRASCEEAKIHLSFNIEAQIELPWDEDVFEIKRNEFERLNKNIFEKVMQITKRCVEKSQLPINKIDDVILIGGSSSIPAIRKCIRDFFGKDPKSDINPDEAVALGAAIIAFNWEEELPKLPRPKIITPVVPAQPLLTNKPINKPIVSYPKPAQNLPSISSSQTLNKPDLKKKPKPMAQNKPVIRSQSLLVKWPQKLLPMPKLSNRINLTTICAHSIGIELMGNAMHIIIRKNSKLPAKETQKGLYVINEQESVKLKVFSGENKLTKFNTFLGDLHISHIAMAKDGRRKYEATFELDVDGILTVTAEDTIGNSNNLRITLGKHNLSRDEINIYKNRYI